MKVDTHRILTIKAISFFKAISNFYIFTAFKFMIFFLDFYLTKPNIGIMVRVFANGSIPVWVIPKTQKGVLDISLLNT